MNNDLWQYLIAALEDWHSQLGEIEVHYEEENDMVDNQGAKEDLLREINKTRSKLERIGDSR